MKIVNKKKPSSEGKIVINYVYIQYYIRVNCIFHVPAKYSVTNSTNYNNYIYKI